MCSILQGQPAAAHRHHPEHHPDWQPLSPHGGPGSGGPGWDLSPDWIGAPAGDFGKTQGWCVCHCLECAGLGAVVVGGSVKVFFSKLLHACAPGSVSVWRVLNTSVLRRYKMICHRGVCFSRPYCLSIQGAVVTSPHDLTASEQVTLVVRGGCCSVRGSEGTGSFTWLEWGGTYVC